jgi:hypothetical protein
MTRRERAQVVELLRCAADCRPDNVGLNGMFDTACWLDLEGHWQDKAWQAINAVPTHSTVFQVVGTVDEEYRRVLLEAAARVEEGTWP